ncbi:unnamed protein product [Calypogeia fissa]
MVGVGPVKRFLRCSEWNSFAFSSAASLPTDSKFYTESEVPVEESVVAEWRAAERDFLMLLSSAYFQQVYGAIIFCE